MCGIVQTGAGSPVTTSAGRLFDAVSALCGIRAEVTYEGQAAAELEGAADPAERGAYEVPVEGEGGAPLVLDPAAGDPRTPERPECGGPGGDASRRVFTAGLPRRRRRRPSAPVASAGSTPSSSQAACSRTGSCSSALERGSRRPGLRTLVPVALPPNDGGISYGQIAVAAARLAQA